MATKNGIDRRRISLVVLVLCAKFLLSSVKFFLILSTWSVRNKWSNLDQNWYYNHYFKHTQSVRISVSRVLGINISAKAGKIKTLKKSSVLTECLHGNERVCSRPESFHYFDSHTHHSVNYFFKLFIVVIIHLYVPWWALYYVEMIDPMPVNVNSVHVNGRVPYSQNIQVTLYGLVSFNFNSNQALSIQRSLEWKSHNDWYSMSVHFCSDDEFNPTRLLRLGCLLLPTN